MRLDLAELRRRALALLKAGLEPYAERALGAWTAAADTQEAWPSAAEAAMWTIRLALRRDRPVVALAAGAVALPRLSDRRRLDPSVVARVHICLAEAAWCVGNDAEMRIFTGAAREMMALPRVDPLVRARYGVIESVVALHAGDMAGATAWALQALDVAEAVGDGAAILACRQHLCRLLTEQARFDQARAAAGDLVEQGTHDDTNLVELLVDGVHIALGEGELARAGLLARRAVQAYCGAPSLLGPIRAGRLFEALAHHQAACGGGRTAELLGETAHGWFALRHRQRDAGRVKRWLANLRSRPASAPTAAEPGVDPDLLYLGDLLAAATRSPDADAARSLARSVHRLLGEVDRSAQRAPCENAALLWRLTATERWFTGRSAAGRAAEGVLGGADAAGRNGVELLAGYEQLAAAGASWTQSQRSLRRGGADPRGLANLERLYRQAVG